MVKMFLLLSILALTWSSVFPLHTPLGVIAFVGRCRNTAGKQVGMSQDLGKQKTAGKCLQECLKQANATNGTACASILYNGDCRLYSAETAYGRGGGGRICYVFY